MTQKLLDYRILIVRAWAVQSEKDGETIWRYTVEVPNSGMRFGFASMQSLLEALDRELLSSDSSTMTNDSQDDTPPVA